MSETGTWVDALAAKLDTDLLGRRIVHRERVGSTNDLARELAEQGADEGTLVVAEEQTAGRGRMGRAWIAPPRSSLLMSFILRPGLAPQQIGRVTMATAVGVCEGIRHATGLYACIKWPNDIVVNDKKCAGILTEAHTLGDQVEYVVVGVGVNVNFAAASVEGILADATTISDELSRAFSRVELARSVLKSIEEHLLGLGVREDAHALFAEHLATLGRRIEVRTPWGIEQGIAENVDQDGALLLRRDDGSTARLFAGDVTLSINE
jgi:BirA family biotin operon repressor/biotin-[acetyl-CoA-carboxylase] ligase